MKISKNIKFKLFILLIILNLILRYSIPHHEIFNDSFEMHILANSLSEFGEARWWTNSAAIVGMHPNSYASMVSFLLSGISQCTGLDIEYVTFVYGLIFGLFTIFAGYILAGMIYDDDLFKFGVAFGFSLSPAVLAYSTWTAHARSPFVLLLPLFVYALLRFREYPFRFGLITFSLSLLLLATHHMVFYLMPVFAGFFAAMFILKFKGQTKSILDKVFMFLLKAPLPNMIKDYIKSLKSSDELIPFILIIGFLLMFGYSFVTHSFMTIGSRWANLSFMANEYPRYTGILIFLSIGGFIYLLFKQHKQFGEWFLLLCLMFLTPFLQEHMYMKWFIVLFAILFAGMGLMNLNRLYKEKKKFASFAIVFFLVLSVCFSGYFQFLHPYSKSGSIMERYLEDGTYTMGIWAKKNMDGNSISNDRWIGWRVASISGRPILTGSATDDQAYGFVDVSEFELVKNPITSEEFWIDSPYRRVKGTVSDGYWQYIVQSEYNSNRGSELIQRFNLRYVVENTRAEGYWLSHHGYRLSGLLESIYDKKNCIYDNGNINVWYL